MYSAFGIDHGEISKLSGEYGWHSDEGRKRTMKEIRGDAKMKAGHGNKQRLAAHTAVGTGTGAGLGALTGGIDFGAKGAAIGAGVGAGLGALTGASTGSTENLQRSGQRNLHSAIKRGDVRRVKPGERTTAFSNRIVKD